MASKKKIDNEHAKRLQSEIGKVRCWLTGFHAARGPNDLPLPGEDSLRQVQIFLADLTNGKS